MFRKRSFGSNRGRYRNLARIYSTVESVYQHYVVNPTSFMQRDGTQQFESNCRWINIYGRENGEIIRISHFYLVYILKVFAIVEKAGTIVMNHLEELDSWSVIINGHVEIEHCDGRIEHLRCGDRLLSNSLDSSRYRFRNLDYGNSTTNDFYFIIISVLVFCRLWKNCFTKV